MYRRLASRLAFCIALLAPLGLEARADPIQMTLTGSAGYGPVNVSQVLTDATLAAGDYIGPGALGSEGLGPNPTGTLDVPVSLTMALTNPAAPGSQGLTLSLSGSLTGFFIPASLRGGDPSVAAGGTIDSITVSGRDPATNQVISATVQGPNGTLDAAALAQFASIGNIPQSLLAPLATPGQYQVDGDMLGGVAGIYDESLWIRPTSAGAPIPAPEPAPLAILGLASVAYLVGRAQAARKDSIP
jgi:hypothetical protein